MPQVELAERADPGQPRLGRTRRLPTWVQAATVFFTTGANLFWLLLGLVPLAMLDVAVADDAAYAVLPIVLAGMTAMICALVLEFGRSQLLRGLPGDWHEIADAGRAVIAAALCLLVGLIHPALALGPVVAAAIALAAAALFHLGLKHRVRRRIDAPLALAILSGRETLADTVPPPFDRDGFYHLAERLAAGLAFLLAMGFGVPLVIGETLTTGGAVSAALLAGASGWGLARAVFDADRHRCGRAARAALAPRVTSDAAYELSVAAESADPERVTTGLFVARLSATENSTGQALLSDVSFDVRPGEIVGVTGGVGAGKTLLLRAMANPFALEDLGIRGAAILDGRDLWNRDTRPARIACVHVDEDPVFLDAPAADNICAFLDADAPERARRALERLNLFGIAAERILRTEDARRLSATERQLAALARALHVGPDLYLLDRPEQYLDARTLGALTSALKTERHRGRAVLVATDCRPILDLCDRIIVLDGGKVIDFDRRERIEARRESGWVRFEINVDAETEDRLHNWLSAQFNRRGDEENRRNLCLAASDLLALARPEGEDGQSRLAFDFRHRVGECHLAMYDQGGLLTATQLAEARRLSGENARESARTPLANLLRRVIDLEQEHAEAGSGWQRRIELRVATYDPRKVAPADTEAAAGGAPGGET